MSTDDVFVEFYDELMESLPMDDMSFITKLHRHRLLPGDVKYKMKSRELTPEEKASYFLDNVIEPTIGAGVDRGFYQLLDVMDDSKHHKAEILAKEIRDKLKEGKANNATTS